MIIKKISLNAASIISLFILILYYLTNSISANENIKYYSKDEGILSIMYHRFNESKYPSTNIQMSIFKEQIDLIKNSNLLFYNPKNLVENFDKPKKQKQILITIDDAFKSFYTEAWPYLKKNKIPFILFVSTEPVGRKGYMTWDQILEVEGSEFAMIGHHSHTHDYLIDKTNQEFINDIKKANKLFLENLGYIPSMFSYPFGEYSKFMKDYISKNFQLSFGQHSGVIDVNKEKFELPRFPINENYGQIKRFKSIISYFPLEYKNLEPEEKKISIKDNPPIFKVEFFNNQKNLDIISCYSNEGVGWDKTNIELKNNKLNIIFREKFKERRGRINCSMRDVDGWRWLGFQFALN